MNRDSGFVRYRPLTRILMLARLIEGRKYIDSMKALSRQIGVCERTTRRYLEALERAGWPVPRWRQDASKPEGRA